jgi:hypothetical protein
VFLIEVEAVRTRAVARKHAVKACASRTVVPRLMAFTWLRIASYGLRSPRLILKVGRKEGCKVGSPPICFQTLSHILDWAERRFGRNRI